MRKLLFFLLLLPLAAMAQGKFGYFSYSEVLKSIPQYKKATESYNKLKQRCNDEIERNKIELTRNYVAFLNGQRDFPEPILRKRQKELQQLVDNSVAFRDQLKAWLLQAKDSLYAPCHNIVDQALVRVCSEMQLSYAVDTDNSVYRYINPAMGEDITQDIIAAILNPEAPVRSLVKPEEPANVAGDENVEQIETGNSEEKSETSEAETAGEVTAAENNGEVTETIKE